jgi:hypothetical protein
MPHPAWRWVAPSQVAESPPFHARLHRGANHRRLPGTSALPIHGRHRHPRPRAPCPRTETQHPVRATHPGRLRSAFVAAPVPRFLVPLAIVPSELKQRSKQELSLSRALSVSCTAHPVAPAGCRRCRCQLSCVSLKCHFCYLVRGADAMQKAPGTFVPGAFGCLGECPFRTLELGRAEFVRRYPCDLLQLGLEQFAQL